METIGGGLPPVVGYLRCLRHCQPHLATGYVTGTGLSIVASSLGQGLVEQPGGQPPFRRLENRGYTSGCGGSIGLAALPSPLYPIYASLYKALKKDYLLVSIVGFADDTNLLAFRKNP